MKKLIFSFLALGALMITACSSDPCKDKTATTLCTGNGTLVDKNGTCGCDCNVATTGANCNIAITGTYSANGDTLGTSTAIPAYTSSVTISGNNVIITNFKNGFFQNLVTGSISGKTITVAETEPDNDGYKIKGTGTISYSGTVATITWNYTISGPNASGTIVTDNINGVWVK